MEIETWCPIVSTKAGIAACWREKCALWDDAMEACVFMNLSESRSFKKYMTKDMTKE